MGTRSPILPLFLMPVWLMVSLPVAAQEGTWTVSASAGAGLLSFRQVDQDGRSDIAAYNRLGIPIGAYPLLKIAPVIDGSIQYRFERDMAIRIFGMAVSPVSRTSYTDTSHALSLERKLRSTMIGLDGLYFFPPLIGNAEIALLVGLGRLAANAQQTTHESEIIKSGPGTETRSLQDAFATYDKSKLAVRAGATISVPLMGQLAIGGSVLYVFAPLGTMTGTLREFATVRDHETTIEFDYSTLDITAGLTYSF